MSLSGFLQQLLVVIFLDWSLSPTSSQCIYSIHVLFGCLYNFDVLFGSWWFFLQVFYFLIQFFVNYVILITPGKVLNVNIYFEFWEIITDLIITYLNDQVSW